VVVDCTTLPAQLVESELFGHERGAFTGADRRVPGKVELAEGGTLFLDELGELPPGHRRAKLLRFLQERTFERVGGRQTLSRGRAGGLPRRTSRRSSARWKRGAFRRDLYYRVQRGRDRAAAPASSGGATRSRRSPGTSPSSTRRATRGPLRGISDGAIAALRAHTFPGNVRELEHWIEAAVALAPDGAIVPELFPAPSGVASAPPPAGTTLANAVSIPLGLSLEEASRRYIDATLAAAGGNKSDAAKRLGVGRNSIGRWLGKR
jgi:DNA-binding NtrC family response regulator